MDELSEIIRLIFDLEEKIKQLEEENTALKRAILGACDSLVQGNKEMSNALTSKKTALYKSNFKQPKWKTK
jgi:hypothetical protein